MMIRRDLVDKWQRLKTWIRHLPSNTYNYIVKHLRGICIFFIVCQLLCAILAMVGLILGVRVNENLVSLVVMVICIITLSFIAINCED